MGHNRTYYRNLRKECMFDIELLNLNPYEYRIYSYMLSNADDDGIVFESINDIAKSCHISSCTTRRIINNLSTDFERFGNPLFEKIQLKDELGACIANIYKLNGIRT